MKLKITKQPQLSEGRGRPPLKFYDDLASTLPTLKPGEWVELDATQINRETVASCLRKRGVPGTFRLVGNSLFVRPKPA
jgi:hypothetical protein